MSEKQKQHHVVSVSIGSSDRDHSVDTEIMGMPFKIERIGTDGDMDKACAMIRDLDGKVDAIGLGGIDLYVYVGKKRYTLRSAKRLQRSAKISPVFDGSLLKISIEKAMITLLHEQGKYLRTGSKVLLVSSVDRYGMAESFHDCGCDMVYGDMMFTLNLNLPIKKISQLRFLAKFLLPVVSQLPIEMLYPTGEKQHERVPKWSEHYKWADVIAGDYHIVHRFMPDDMAGKIVITNTTTAKNVEELKSLGVAALITTMPEFEGRSFGTNVMEGVYSTLMGKNRANPPTAADFLQLLKRMDLKPRISVLNE